MEAAETGVRCLLFGTVCRIHADAIRSNTDPRWVRTDLGKAAFCKTACADNSVGMFPGRVLLLAEPARRLCAILEAATELNALSLTFFEICRQYHAFQ